MGSVTSTRSLRSVARILEESQGRDVHFEFEDEDGDLRTVHIFNRDQQTVDRTNSSALHDEEEESDDDVEVIAEGEGQLLNARSQSLGGEQKEEGEEEEEEGEVETDSDTEDERDDVSHISTLRMLARLFGGRTAVPRTRKAMARDRAFPPAVPMSPSCDLYHEMMQCSLGAKGETRGNNICTKLAARQLCRNGLSQGQAVNLTQHILPRHSCLVDIYTAKVFCGTYNKDGSVFISAVQDNRLYIYDVCGKKFDEHKSVLGRDIAWAILDVVFSPDQYWFAYSTWSNYINICNVYGEEDKHYSLDLRPDTEEHFCAFSLRFSHDGNELVVAASDGYLYIYNRDTCDRTLKIDAHQDDADAVAFDDQSSQIIFSAGDDGLCKVWDRRTLSESHPRPVGSFAGHKDGITFIDTKGDGRYLITNSKDQSIKLWDLRKFSKKEAISATLHQVQRQNWDYRWQTVPRRVQREALAKLPGDTSVMTYTGHLVKNTLLRARFSPIATTGQKYIYTTCAKGRVIVFDVLTGEVVQTLLTENYRNCIRDAAWHPTNPGELVSSSWDSVLQLWTPHKRPNYVQDMRRRFFDI